MNGLPINQDRIQRGNGSVLKQSDKEEVAGREG